jgi:hypothetical protein
MFPDRATDAHVALFSGSEGWDRHLRRYDVALVLIDRAGPLAQTLDVDPAWRRLEREEGWSLFCRRGADLGGDIGRC